MDDDLWTPIEFGPVSSDEYRPLPVPEAVREARRRTLETADDHARRSGMTRRSFLRSAAGAATALFWLNACTSAEQRAGPSAAPSPTGSPPSSPGGTFSVSPEATIDQPAAAATLGGEEFVFDVQSHLLEYDLEQPLPGSFWGDSFPQARCGDGDPRACFSIEHYLEEIFLNSDTTMCVLSALPIVTRDHPLSIDVMEEARAATSRLCGEGRLLLHGQANPNIGDPEDTFAGMEELVANHPVSAWKIYTHVGPGWLLDDADPDGVQVGNDFLDVSERLGVNRVCVHKGVSRNDPFATPADIGPAAAAHPGIDFVVYHSGWEPGTVEGPYTEETRDVGINRLISSLLDAGIGPGDNVHAELGTTWFNLMRDPTQGAHVWGKLLKHLGPDNVMWGTDSIWYGSPQQQITAFRSFEISAELQETYGYPALTDEVKRRILGANAARLYDVDPVSVECRFTRQELEEIRTSG